MDKLIRRRQTSSNAILQCRDDEKRSQNQVSTSISEIKPISCPFKSCGCNFESNDSALIDLHTQNDISTHLTVSKLKNFGYLYVVSSKIVSYS